MGLASPKEASDTQLALKEYCTLDTRALAEVHSELERLARDA
jgi:hypothetical protein